MQNYDGQFKLNGQEYFYRATPDLPASANEKAFIKKK